MDPRAAPSPRTPPAGRAWFAAVLVVAAALRLGALDKPLYVDEISTITVASQPLDSMAAVMRQIDASPALYPVLLHFWLGVSRADAWVRLLSAIFGVLGVVVVGLLGRRAFGWRAGVAAAGIMAIAPAHVEYAQYVRSYSLFTLLAAAHVWLVIDWMDDRVRLTAGRAAAFVFTTTALFYTHYLSILLLPAEGLFVLVHWRQARTRVLAWTAAVAAAAVLFLPGVPLLLHNIAFDRIRNSDRPEPPALVRMLPDLVSDLNLGQRSLGYDDRFTRRFAMAASLILFPALWLAGVARGVRTRRDLVLLLCAVSILPIAIYVGSGRRLVAVRFFLPFMAGYFVLLGCGLASLNRARAVLVSIALIVMCASPLWHFFTRFSWSYDHRAVARAIADRSTTGDVIMVVHPYEAFYYRWYLGQRLPIRGLVFTALEDQEGYVIKPPPVEFERARARIGTAAAEYSRIWIIGQSTRSFASDAREQARVLAWMDETYDRAADLGGLTGDDPIVRLYTARPARLQ
jgi:4-amino-4-deoxy-L-arabinose transferase-like glycosyltransferase